MEREVGYTRQGDAVLKERGREGKTMRDDDVKRAVSPVTLYILMRKKSHR